MNIFGIYTNKYVALVIVAISAFTALLILRSGYIMNGDYALYIAQAKHILSGTQHNAFQDMTEMLRLSTYKYYSPTLYPWGFPLLLSPLVAFFGINYTAFKVFVVICFALGLWFMHLTFRDKGDVKIALAMVSLIGFNIKYMEFANLILSDIPYFLFLMLSFYVINRHQLSNTFDKGQVIRHLILGVVLFFTVQIRTEGYFLLPVLFAYQCFVCFRNKRSLKLKKNRLINAIVPYFVIGGLSAVFMFFFPAGYLGHSGHLSNVYHESIINNLLFYYDNVPITSFPFLKAENKWFIVLFWIFVFLGLLKSVKNAVPETTYTLIAISFLIIWPYANSRYFASLIPVLLYFFLNGLFILSVISKYKYLSLRGVVILGLVVVTGIHTMNEVKSYDKSYDNFDMNVESENAQNMIKYISEKTQSNDIIGCCESRTIYLYTNRLSCNLFGDFEDTVLTADWYVSFRNRGNYLQYYPEELSENSEYFQENYRNDEFIVYKVLKNY